MKRKISIIVVVLLILSVVPVFSGCTNKKVEESLALVDEYYESFRENDPDDVVKLFDDSLIDFYDGKSKATIVIASRIGVLGEDVEYNVVGKSVNTDSEGTFVIIDVEATYDRDGETYSESFQMEEIDEEMYITAMSMDREKALDDVPTDFFNEYNFRNNKGMKDLLAGSFYDLFTDEEIDAFLDNYYNVLGPFNDMEIYNEYSVNSFDGEELVVQEAHYNASFESGDANIDLYLCNDDEEIKIYDIYIIPDFVDETATALFESFASMDIAGAIDMYDEYYFVYTQTDEDILADDIETVLSYGDYSGYEITNWFYYDEFYGDASLGKCLMFSADVTFGDTVFYNEITVSLEDGNYKIIDHYLDFAE